jgi:hypothetical protein
LPVKCDPPLAVRVFIQGDQVRFTPREDFRLADAIEPLNACQHENIIFTLLDGDAVRGVGGVTLWDPPNGWHLWARMADLRPREWLQASILASHLLLSFHMNYPDAVVTASANTEAGRRLLERLGFYEFEDDELQAMAGAYRILRRAA